METNMSALERLQQAARNGRDRAAKDQARTEDELRRRVETAFQTTLEKLESTALASGKCSGTIPLCTFGEDRDSARLLNALIARFHDEKMIAEIDNRTAIVLSNGPVLRVTWGLKT